MVRSLALVAGLAAVLAAPLQGQVRIAITPFAGGYFPVGNVVDQEFLRGELINEIGQEPGFGFGGRIALRVAKLGIEAEGGYVLSSVDIPQSPADPDDLDEANLLLASLNVTFDVFQAPFSPVAFYVSAGGGIVSRSGNFYDLFDNTTDPAGTVGLGLRFGLGPLATIRLDVRDYISSFKPSRGGVDRDSKVQNDIIATLGLEFGFSPLPY